MKKLLVLVALGFIACDPNGTLRVSDSDIPTPCLEPTNRPSGCILSTTCKQYCEPSFSGWQGFPKDGPDPTCASGRYLYALCGNISHNPNFVCYGVMRVCE